MSAQPLGVQVEGKKAQFTLFSHHATAVVLGLFEREGKLIQEIACDRRGDFWHSEIDSFPEYGTYAFRVEGPEGIGHCFHPEEWLADPYARSIQSPGKWGEKAEGGRAVRAFIASASRPFDWQGVVSPRIARRDLIFYEMHVRGFTRHPSSGVATPGTFAGMMEKIPYLKKLGINAVELMPIFEFDETNNNLKRDDLYNYWGYDPLHFFCPMRRYAARGQEPFGPIDELKELIRELHRNGIEVILDVVYNHTGERKQLDYRIHFRGIDQSIYYMLDREGRLRDYAGCGNVINANQPTVTRFILDSLRYWVEEFHVDGFRFDLAAALTRDLDGKPLAHAPVFEAIEKDPLFSQVKLIAEVWDANGLYLCNKFSSTGLWSEWNGHYRDNVRRFIKGTEGQAGNFANSLCGSDFFFASSKTPLSSINFVTVHDGFTLRDLVSYNQKHNRANGENNRDGSDCNESWNCGTEGITNDPMICELREQQMRNFLLALFFSQGIPMLAMRDEYGHSCLGNNNPYLHDTELNWFVWNERQDIVQFVSLLIAFRQAHKSLRRTTFLTKEEIVWHTGFEGRSLAFTLLGSPSIYVAFNASHEPLTLLLPKGTWKKIFDSKAGWQLCAGEEIIEKIEIAAYAAIVASLKESSLLC